MIAWLARAEQRAVWSYKLMSWDVCGQPAVSGTRSLSFYEMFKKNLKNPHTHNQSCFPIQVSRCSSEGRGSLKIYKANYLIHVGSMEVVDLKHKLGSVNASP